ncbi:MAG: rhodanese-like domain-containing protein [Flavobacteriales bacterium]|nr:rhodanese-like domain-containing protein [Flavobacteriales bacterium]
MKRVYLISLVVLLGFVIGCAQNEPKYEDVSKERFAALIKTGDGLLIDLRTPKEYDQGHIEGAVNIDFFDDHFEDEIAKLDKNKMVYIYCASGGRSGKTLALLKKSGFKTVYHLPIGYNGWVAK